MTVSSRRRRTSAADIVYQEADFELPPGFGGFAWCDGAAGAQTCDQHYVRMRPGTITEALACHETGHAVGLTHAEAADPPSGNGDAAYRCMRTGVPNGSILGPHNVQQINAAYS